MSVLRRKSVYATVLSAAIGAIALSSASPANAFPTCEWIDCVPHKPPVTAPPIKWPPKPVCLSCPFELRDVLQNVVLPALDVQRLDVDVSRLDIGGPHLG